AEPGAVGAAGRADADPDPAFFPPSRADVPRPGSDLSGTAPAVQCPGGLRRPCRRDPGIRLSPGGGRAKPLPPPAALDLQCRGDRRPAQRDHPRHPVRGRTVPGARVLDPVLLGAGAARDALRRLPAPEGEASCRVTRSARISKSPVTLPKAAPSAERY